MSWNTYNVNLEKLTEKLVESLSNLNSPCSFIVQHESGWELNMMMFDNKIIIHKYSDTKVINIDKIANIYDVIERIDDVIIDLYKKFHSSLSTNDVIERMECRYIDDDKHCWGCKLTEFYNMIIDHFVDKGPKQLLLDTVTEAKNKSENWGVFLNFTDGENEVNVTVSRTTISAITRGSDGKLKFRSLWWDRNDLGHSMSANLFKFIKDANPSIDNTLMTASIITNKSSNTIPNMMSRITLGDFITSIVDLFVIIKTNN